MIQKQLLLGAGKVKIEDGQKEFRIDVTAESGTVRTYMLYISEEVKKQEQAQIEEQQQEQSQIGELAEETSSIAETEEIKNADSNNIFSNYGSIVFIVLVVIIAVIIFVLLIVKSKKGKKNKGKHA